MLTSVNSSCRNQHETAVFEREGKSVATEQGAGVEGCDPARPHEGVPPVEGFPPNTTAMELSTNPVPALSALATRPSFL